MSKSMSKSWDKLKSSQFYDNYKHSKVAIVASIILILILLLAVFGPLFTVQNPYKLGSLDLNNAYLAPWPAEGSNAKYFLGTDQQGRDMFSAIVYGSRTSLFIGIVGVILCSALGVFLGLLAGYYGGKLDSFIMRLADVQLSFPSMLIALFLMSVFGRGIGNILISLTLIGWVKFARTVRGETLSVRKKEYVDAARVMGLPDWKIILKYILPNVLTSIIVLATMQVGNFILIEATLSFLGLGVPVTEPSLGMLCSDGFNVMFGGMWWVSVFPGLYIVLIVFAINLLGDFLRDELNPKLK
ncbi:MAG: ABC transporter permease [Clostridia bacterium]